jgi:hypothetical protein
MLSILTCTGRQNPQFKTLADTIAFAAGRLVPLMRDPNWLEWVVVDMQLWQNPEARRQELSDAVAGRIRTVHVPPKPTVWQGPHRLTKKDWWALNNARNTGLCYVTQPHVVLLDDCCAVTPEWLYWHLLAAQRKTALAGSFRSVTHAEIVDGMIVNVKPYDEGDHRAIQTQSLSPVRCGGGWLYGLNCSFPLEAALEIDGYDETYDGQGGSEDSDHGVRLDRAGVKVFYCAQAPLYQLMETHEEVCHSKARMQKTRVLAGDGLEHYANEYLIEILHGRTGYRPLTPTLLPVLREWAQAGEELPFIKYPVMDWRDGEMLEDM